MNYTVKVYSEPNNSLLFLMGDSSTPFESTVSQRTYIQPSVVPIEDMVKKLLRILSKFKSGRIHSPP